MYGYIYKTTNLINGKIYIGQKKSDKFLGQSYLGSGKVIRREIRVHGKDNFKVELLEEIDCIEEMDEREIYWIAFYNSTNKEIGYNISEGGNVNRTFVGENNPFYGKHHSEETISKLREMNKGHQAWNKGLTKETDERVLKYSLNSVNKSKIAKDTLWINNGLISKMVKKELVEEYLDKGWYLGRLPLPKESYKFIALGRIRINNGVEEKNVHEDELEIYLANGWKRGRLSFKDTSKFGKQNSISVLCVETGIIYKSIKDAAKDIHTAPNNISRCCKNNKCTAHGYHWVLVKGKE